MREKGFLFSVPVLDNTDCEPFIAEMIDALYNVINGK